MKRIKTLLIFSLVIALSFSLFGCKLLPWGDSAAEETAAIAELPQWLTLAHRAEAAEEPEMEEEEVAEEEEESAEAPAQTATTQPATTQQPAQSSGTPKWQQPGTMEYLAKIHLDTQAREYRQLQIRYNNATEKGVKEDLKKEMFDTLMLMSTLAAEIGLDIKKEYGFTPPAAVDSSSSWTHQFDNMESPSGFGSDFGAQ